MNRYLSKYNIPLQDELASDRNKYLRLFNEEYRGYKFRFADNSFRVMFFDDIEFSSYDKLVKFIDRLALDSAKGLC